MPRWRREDLVFWSSALALIAAQLAPIWVTSWPPMGDLGAHVELIDIAQRHGDATTLYGAMYTAPQLWRPQSFVLLVAWILRGVPALTVAKLCLSFYVVAWPLSVQALSRAFGRSRWNMFWAFPLTFNGLVSVGFLTFLVALPVLVFVVAAGRRVAARPSRANASIVATGLVWLWFLHAMAFAFALALVCVLLVVERSRPRQVAVTLLVGVAGLALLPDALRAMGLPIRMLAWPQHVTSLHFFGLQYLRDSSDELVASVLASVWVYLAAVAIAQRSRLSLLPGSLTAAPQWLRSHPLVALLGALGSCFLLLPATVGDADIIGERLVVLIGVVLSALVALDPRDRSHRLALAVLWAVSAGYAGWLTMCFRDFEEDEVGRLPALIAALPDRTLLGVVLDDRWTSYTHVGSVWHLAKGIHAVANGGATDHSFAHFSHTPTRYVAGRQPPSLPRHSAELAGSSTLGAYDYLLVRSHAEPVAVLGDPRLRLIGHDRAWWLFAIRARLAAT